GTPLTLVHTRTVYDPLGAAKLTGKQGGLTIGVLGALDEHPLLPAGDATADGGPPGQHAIFDVVRLKQDVGRSSTVGVLTTDREGGVEAGWLGKPNRGLQRWRVSLRGDQLYNHAGFREESYLRPRLELDFARQIVLAVRAQPWVERFAAQVFHGTRLATSLD